MSELTERTKIPLGKVVAISSLCIASGVTAADFKRDLIEVKTAINAIEAKVEQGLVTQHDMEVWLLLLRNANPSSLNVPDFPRRRGN